MGSGLPVRRFDALRDSLRCGPPRRPKPCGDPPCAFVLLQRHPPEPRRVPRARGRARRTRLPLLGFFGPTTHSRSVSRDDRGSRRDPRPRAGFGYPLRGARHWTSRRAKRRSVPGLLPSGLVPRGRRELLSESLPSWRCPPARRTVRCTREPSRLQGLALATDPYRRRSLGDRPSLPSWGSPPQSSPHPSGHCALVARPPLPPQARADVPARQGLRVLRNGWIGASVSGRPALSGFFTS